MAELGISLYPEQSTPDQDRAYLKAAATLGYTRVFTSLLQLAGEAGTALATFKATVAYANELGFKVVADLNPALFKELGISYDDLSWFQALGIWGVRLDEGFTGMEEAAMTRNPFGLKIELNMSQGGHYIDSVMGYQPNHQNLIGCHNFYPQAYSGLSEAHFLATSQQYRDYGLRSAAFVSAPSGSFGPWPVNEGLPTLESDRTRPIASQVMHIRMSGLIDDVLIGNAYASQAELAAAAEAFWRPNPALHVELGADLAPIERTIVLAPNHLYRGDASAYLLRDTQPRVQHAGDPIPARPAPTQLQRGDIVVVNADYARYKGELQIILQAMPNDGRRNLCGRLTAADLGLLADLRPWSRFDLVAGE